MHREFRHLTHLNLVTIVFKSAEGREFRSKFGVPTVESSSIHWEFRRLTTLLQLNYRWRSVSHTGRVRYGNGYKTASFSKGAINTPKPPPLEVANSADPLAHF